MRGNGSPGKKDENKQGPPEYPCPYANWTRPSDVYAPNFNRSQPPVLRQTMPYFGRVPNNIQYQNVRPPYPSNNLCYPPVVYYSDRSNGPSTSGSFGQSFDNNQPSTSSAPNEDYDSWDEEEESSTVPAPRFQNYQGSSGVQQETNGPSTSAGHQKPDNSESDTTEEYVDSGPEEDLSWDGGSSEDSQGALRFEKLDKIAEEVRKKKYQNPYEELDREVEEKIRNPPGPNRFPLTTAGFLDFHFKSLGLDDLFSESPSPPPAPVKPKKTTQWTTREPIRHNLPLPEGSGTIWESNGDIWKEKTEEKKVEKKQMHPDVLNRLVFMEEQRNIFSPFYSDSKSKKDRRNFLKHPQNYRHKDAINFAAISHTWTETWDLDLRLLPRAPGLVMPLPNSTPEEETICAFYRVLAEREQKYILIACHVNVHGYHRGDLRFIEVNAFSQLDGFTGQNVIGNLFLGDIVAVTELARNSNAGNSKLGAPVSSVSQETPCYWIAAKMILLPRDHIMPVTFSFLKNRMAVVKGDDEPMRVTVEDWDTVTTDLIYVGRAFKPMKLESNFTEDFGKQQKNQITTKATKISSYPNAFGTIFTFEECTDENEQFGIGTDAFSSKTEMTIEEREKVVETCSLMGFSAANTIFNGRFDCRAFHMRQIYKNGLIVKFLIDNPAGQPTLGLWNSGNRIMFGGPEGDLNATIETVISEDNLNLRITARLSRETPKSVNFKNGEFFVSQREITDHYFLHDRYFHDLEPESNGRHIIETLYGAEPLKLVKIPSKHQQYYFPSFPHPIALNQYQNEYVQMLLDGNPLIIGSSPFGCGKSMTIITAALEIYRRNCEMDVLKNQRQQLLITQSNYASVNLIDIAQRICSTTHSDLKFVRFVTEKNWNELPDNCRTEYDMPFLMNKIFSEWATGRIEVADPRLRRLNPHHHNHMLAYVLKNKLVQLTDLAGGGRRTYDRNGNFKMIAFPVITEAFFHLYHPDLIMTTADSSKNLLSVLTEVCTVQIDEASQLPEYTLLGLLKTFNRANFGLIGDIHQLPPYCEDNLDGKLKDYGIGNTMERAIHGRLFPISTLRFVYRCHPKITELLSELFYDGALLSGVTEDQRNDFVLKRRDFWPNSNYPMMIVNNEGPSFRMGTSHGNDSEKELVKKMILNLINDSNHPVRPLDIGVISFYAAQTSILTEHLRGTGVKCGTVDAFQGTEKEIIITCCTRDTVSDFMQMSNRLNVAMSRAKQATIIVGNVEGLRKAQYWNRIVQKVEENRNLVHAANFNETRQYPPTYPPMAYPINPKPQPRVVNVQMSPNRYPVEPAARQNYPAYGVQIPKRNVLPTREHPKPPPLQYNQRTPYPRSASVKEEKPQFKINPSLVAQLEDLRAKENQRATSSQPLGRWSSRTYRSSEFN
uniref:AAA_12 domain-containing protein n=1 Tax=Caenorhabditis tropicalis TaxID=1561998 RepID=A0A1I7T7U0_9PELO